MKPNDYIKRAKKLDQNYENVQTRMLENPENLTLMHAALGLAGETGEAVDLIKKSLMYGKPLDHDKMKKECGDILWYMAILLYEIDSSFEEIMRMNIEKLEKRYPNGFTEQDAIARKDVT